MTARLHHVVDGPADAPVLVLAPPVGMALDVWEPQVEELAQRWRVVRFDLRGHGGSEVLPSPYTMDDLADDALALLDGLGVGRFAWAGISIGGAVGLTIAVRGGQRLTSLALLCSSAFFGGADVWRERMELVLRDGMEAAAALVPGRWFTAASRERMPETVETAVLMTRRTAPDGYLGCCAALAGYDLRERLDEVRVPTLVLGGREDPATPPEHAGELTVGIPDARLVLVPGASHLASVEQPLVVTRALSDHFTATWPGVPEDRRRAARHDVTDAEHHADGMAVRREVLGDAHVDRAIARTSAFTAPFQDLITRYAWGDIWTRPALDRRTRSCITITALIARGHLDELGMHVRAALRNGLTPTEIGEVILQCGIYCGVPAANAAFAVAQRVLREEGLPEAEPTGADVASDPAGSRIPDAASALRTGHTPDASSVSDALSGTARPGTDSLAEALSRWGSSAAAEEADRPTGGRGERW